MTTGNTINENTITNIINTADDYIYKRLHDYDELEYGTEVMRIGGDGYIPYGEWNKAFTGMPEWAKDAYIILGNEKELDMESLGKIGPIKRLTTEEVFGY